MNISDLSQLDLKNFEVLKEIIARLRGPNGCPWDKEQTHESLVPFAIEEVYEFIDTIENKEKHHEMKEELGDVLFQVLLHSQLASEKNNFNIYDVIANLSEKMIRRHPHVFGNEIASTSEEVLKNWAVIKKQEKQISNANNRPATKNTNNFDIPTHLPALQRALKIGNKSKKSGFDWENLHDLFAKIKEECMELEETITYNESKERQEEELGDLLFAIAQMARHLNFDPETSLRKANNKFEKRYFKMVQLANSRNLNFEELSLLEKEELWKEIKNC